MKKNKMTKEEKNAKKLALIEERKQKRAEKKAKREAKRAAQLEKKRAKMELKKQKQAEKKAKKQAKIEKEKARKAAIREKKRLAREKKRAAEKVMKLKLKAKNKKQKTIVKIDKTKNADVIDIKSAAKTIKSAMNSLAKEFASFDSDTISKKAKKIASLGYDVEVADGKVIVRFIDEVSKKAKNITQTNDVVEPEVVEQPKENEEDEPKVEMIPAGDLLGTDGQVNEAEVANVEVDDENVSSNDETAEDYFADEDEDDTISDSRDETDDDLIESRRDFFANAADFGEDIDN